MNFNPQEKYFLYHLAGAEKNIPDFHGVAIHDGTGDTYEDCWEVVHTFPYIPQKMVAEGYAEWVDDTHLAVTPLGMEVVNKAGGLARYEEDTNRDIAAMNAIRARVPAGVQSGDIVRLRSGELAYVFSARYLKRRGTSLRVFRLLEKTGVVEYIYDAEEITPIKIQKVSWDENIGWSGYRIIGGGWLGSIRAYPTHDGRLDVTLEHAGVSDDDSGYPAVKLGVALDLLLCWLIEKGV